MTPRFARLSAAALAVLVVLLGAPGPAQASLATDYANSAVRATNDHRAAKDRVRLGKSECLREYALKQARRMALQERMYHQDLGPIMRACKLSRAGENVAYGYSSGRSTVSAWMKSPGHRANILNSGYRHMGIAAQRRNGVWYVAQVFGRRA